MGRKLEEVRRKEGGVPVYPAEGNGHLAIHPTRPKRRGHFLRNHHSTEGIINELRKKSTKVEVVLKIQVVKLYTKDDTIRGHIAKFTSEKSG